MHVYSSGLQNLAAFLFFVLVCKVPLRLVVGLKSSGGARSKLKTGSIIIIIITIIIIIIIIRGPYLLRVLLYLGELCGRTRRPRVFGF